MKKIFAGLFLAGTFALASAQTISFDKTVFDYGNVKTGADGHRVFKIKNTGDKPLIISRVQASCGCTTPEWSQEPIMPGKTADLKVGYDTKIVGPFTKIIEVYSNDADNSRSVITIKGNIGDAVATIAPQSTAKAESTMMSSEQATKVAPAAKAKAQVLKAKSL
ncbi:DUF1573 domain-containing protein [Kaistella flava (ex Peng et al. 2021)]|uniref:DUF1573 domain-containing protein n=1 Tax=Kaistella flava (ex Peng et al. 2021) TaxID=2038776 RepID=A0A7M2YAU7_9FLAO|nr:DUF1573 domain-containing protein [Kaistella flava (ex Peng et al. 2021)]QOW10765.1 DUF1573 domain-containing protein [Kaistella flava (ex Peng et al. 2021)]